MSPHRGFGQREVKRPFPCGDESALLEKTRQAGRFTKGDHEPIYESNSTLGEDMRQ